MRVFVVGASGAIGSRLVPQLIDQGHEVIGTCRSPERTERLHALGCCCLDTGTPPANSSDGHERKGEMFRIKMP